MKQAVTVLATDFCDRCHPEYFKPKGGYLFFGTPPLADLLPIVINDVPRIRVAAIHLVRNETAAAHIIFACLRDEKVYLCPCGRGIAAELLAVSPVRLQFQGRQFTMDIHVGNVL